MLILLFQKCCVPTQNETRIIEDDEKTYFYLIEIRVIRL